MLPRRPGQRGIPLNTRKDKGWHGGYIPTNSRIALIPNFSSGEEHQGGQALALMAASSGDSTPPILHRSIGGIKVGQTDPIFETLLNSEGVPTFEHDMRLGLWLLCAKLASSAIWPTPPRKTIPRPDFIL